ncbi:MAG: pyruvate kinase alpha/beta domain-containing protein [Candidatus Bathyarchaeota archaeon]|jgi:hypothetical protein
MGFVERGVRYFNFCGEVNTEDLLETVRNRCIQSGPETVIIASETGRSALKALEIFLGADVKMVVVTHYPAKTWGPEGNIPIGLKREEYSDRLERLQDEGVRVVQGTRPFAPPSRSLDWGSTLEGVLDKALELFGAGTKIAVEAAVMATDAGEVGEGEEVISCAGTFKGLDTAMLVKTAYSMKFFKEFEVKEIIAKPSCRVKKFPEHKYKNWRGDLTKYYPQS